MWEYVFQNIHTGEEKIKFGYSYDDACRGFDTSDYELISCDYID